MSQFLVVVAYNRSLEKYDDKKKYPMGDPQRNTMFGYVSADMAMDPPVPDLTSSEMQSVAFAAKMALRKLMQDRAFKSVKSAGRRKKLVKKKVPLDKLFNRYKGRRRTKAEIALENEYKELSNNQY
jgi:hypothetical protein